MNHRELVLKTLRGERTDRLACGEFFIADEFVRAFVTLDSQSPVEFDHYRAVVEQLDLDIATVSFSAGWGALEHPDEDRALDLLTRWRAAGDRFVFALIDGPFSAAAKARGFNMLLHYIHGAPHAARDLFRRGAEEARVVAQAARDAGADGVILGEDIAYGRSTYIAPKHLRELYFAELRAAAHEIRALGLTVFFHSDGNLNAVLDDLAACELDGLQGLEPEAGMELGAVRARVGPELTLWGNLGFDALASPLTPQPPSPSPGLEVQSRRGGRGRRGMEVRYIFGACAGLVQGMNVETVRQVYRAARITDSGHGLPTTDCVPRSG
ncbi:MAG: hypothetical protein HY782_03625 [Chloroflexi bacterium]|nr:hypothetical protein [Chloroflexota bacterium]